MRRTTRPQSSLVRRASAGARTILLIAAWTGAAGCALLHKAPASASRPSPPSERRSEEGTASWYGEPFHGRQTSNGETYDMHDMTAAHLTLPFHTMVKVTNRANGRSAVVRINDRGPFVKGRIIDLSYAAARALDMVVSGTAPVLLEVVSANEHSSLSPLIPSPDGRGEGAREAPPVGGGAFVVQAGAFASRENAERFRTELSARFGGVYIRSFRDLWRVRVGPYDTMEEASLARERLESMGHEAFVTAED